MTGGTSVGPRIAVVGMACRVPGAQSVAAFWRNLCGGVEATVHLTDDELRRAGVPEELLRDPRYVRSAAPLADVAGFDAPFFGLSPRDAAIMDPQHRHFLECAWEALEDAGHPPRSADGAGSVGVFAGCGMNAYWAFNLLTNPALVRDVGPFLLRHTGNDKDFLATRASFQLDLKGPSVSVQTACSTSLVAIHMACQSLLNGECDVALAGGVTIEVPHRVGYLPVEGEVASPDGRCRAFDAGAQGTFFGSGVGVVVLRRLEDALADGDCVHAVVLGSAVNNDGALKASYLAPSVDGQAEAIAEALAVADVGADTIGYVAAHGTATPIGDPIEVAALTAAFRRSSDRRGHCWLTSLKPNIGHLDTAAGVASFLAAVLAVRDGRVPPSLHFERPNPHIDFAASPFRVADRLVEWPREDGHPRRAGVNSLGVGGTNAHVIVEEPPAPPALPPGAPWQLLPLSARTPAAVDAATRALAAHLAGATDAAGAPDLADVAWTLQVGRHGFRRRRVVVANGRADALRVLAEGAPGRVFDHDERTPAPRPVFVFAGAGGQHAGMARALHETFPAFRRELDACVEAAGRLAPGLDLRPLLLGPAADADDALAEQTTAALPALFAVQLATARLLESFGVRPAAVAGHSSGEYAAACVAGVLDRDDALRLVTLRARLMAALPDSGAMLSVPLPPDELAAACAPFPGVAVGVVNGPALSVAAGPAAGVEALAEALAARGVAVRRVRIAVAGHSALVEPALPEFRAGVAAVRLAPPTLPFYSGLTGGLAGAADLTHPEYWVRHLRQPVRFDQIVAALAEAPDALCFEVGPGQVVTPLLRAGLTGAGAVLPTLRHPRRPEAAEAVLLAAVGRAWAQGVAVDWAALHPTGLRRRVSLPPYPFEHRPHWIAPGEGRLGAAAGAPGEPPAAPPEAAAGAAGPARLADPEDWFHRPTWRRTAAPELPAAAVRGAWVLLADERGVAAALAPRLRARGAAVHLVRPGTAPFTVAADGAGAAAADGTFGLRPADRRDWEQLLGEVQRRSGALAGVVDCGTLSPPDGAPPTAGFAALLALAQALAGAALPADVHLAVVTEGALAPPGEAPSHPEGALLRGPCRVIPAEVPEVRCTLLDVRVEGDADALAERLLPELLAPDGAGEVALRGAERWVPAVEAVRLPAGDPATAGLREESVWLITGGLGGVGLVVAEHLARTRRARLVLVGRAGLPPRAEWDALLGASAPGDRVARRVRAVRALEAAGAAVLVVAADVTDRAALAAAFAAARERFGRVDGVVHAAGRIDDAPLLTKELAAAARVLAPKVDGALLLDELLAEGAAGPGGRAALVLFSSTSAALGLPGQFDYAAANAFLDAFAARRTAAGRGRTLSLAWGAWDRVGMTAPRSASGAAAPGGSGAPAAPERPPLPEWARAVGPDDGPRVRPSATRVAVPSRRRTPGSGAAPRRIEYLTHLDERRDWLLAEHRLADGRALLPGTAYLELLRSALVADDRGAAVELRDVVFFQPLAAASARPREVRVVLEPDGSGHAATVSSRRLGERAWTEHATGHVSRLAGPRPAPQDVAALAARLGGPERTVGPAEPQTRQEEHLAWGPRWRCLRRTRLGKGEALAWLALPEAYEADRSEYTLHPALLDLATGFALALVEGPPPAPAPLYVPVGYERLRQHAPLTQRVISHARLRSGDAAPGRRTVAFDVTLLDERGAVLAEIEGFTMKAVTEPARLLPATGERRPPAGRDDVGTLAVREGITPAEGARAFERAVAAATEPHVWVSPLPLDRLLALRAPGPRRAPAAGAAGTGAPEGPAPALAEAAPRTEVQRTLAGFWQQALGLERVGLRDDFFELGGQSLVAARLFTRIKKTWGVDLPLATLFEAPTIEQCARIIEAELALQPKAPDEPPAESAGAPAAEAPRVPAVPAPRGPARWSSLVAIQPEGVLPPLFVAAGMGGNPLNLRRLALLMGRDRPFYGLQPRSLRDPGAPGDSVEDLAAHYLHELRGVQPAGPYLLGGYSGGGIVAFEMSRQLLADGEAVALLVFLDSFSPRLPRRDLASRARLHASRVIEYGPRYLAGTVGRRLDYERRTLLRRFTRPLRRFFPDELRYQAVEDAWLTAESRYAPEGRIAVPAVLFRAEVETSLSLWSHYVVDAWHGWGRYLEGDVEVRVVPGDHSSMCEDPHVQVLARELRARLDIATPHPLARRPRSAGSGGDR